MQEAHKTFKVHYNTISKWLNRYWEEGHLNSKEAYRQAPAGVLLEGCHKEYKRYKYHVISLLN
jgi:transposase